MEDNFKVLNVVDPGLYWVAFSDSIDLLVLDERLREYLESDDNQQGESFLPQPNEYVVVSNVDGLCCRGIVCSISEPEGEDKIYNVFLLDWAKDVSVGIEQLNALKGLWAEELQPQATLIGLHGFVPFGLSESDLDDPEKSYKKVLAWQNHTGLAKALISSANATSFEPVSKIGSVLYGHLRLLRGRTRWVNIKDELIARNVGCSSDNFETDLLILKELRLLCCNKEEINEAHVVYKKEVDNFSNDRNNFSCSPVNVIKDSHFPEKKREIKTEPSGFTCSKEHFDQLVSFSNGLIVPKLLKMYSGDENKGNSRNEQGRNTSRRSEPIDDRHRYSDSRRLRSKSIGPNIIDKGRTEDTNNRGRPGVGGGRRGGNSKYRSEYSQEGQFANSESAVQQANSRRESESNSREFREDRDSHRDRYKRARSCEPKGAESQSHPNSKSCDKSKSRNSHWQERRPPPDVRGSSEKNGPYEAPEDTREKHKPRRKPRNSGFRNRGTSQRDDFHNSSRKSEDFDCNKEMKNREREGASSLRIKESPFDFAAERKKYLESVAAMVRECSAEVESFGEDEKEIGFNSSHSYKSGMLANNSPAVEKNPRLFGSRKEQFKDSEKVKPVEEKVTGMGRGLGRGKLLVTARDVSEVVELPRPKPLGRGLGIVQQEKAPPKVGGRGILLMKDSSISPPKYEAETYESDSSHRGGSPGDLKNSFASRDDIDNSSVSSYTQYRNERREKEKVLIKGRGLFLLKETERATTGRGPNGVHISSEKDKGRMCFDTFANSVEVTSSPKTHESGKQFEGVAESTVPILSTPYIGSKKGEAFFTDKPDPGTVDLNNRGSLSSSSSTESLDKIKNEEELQLPKEELTSMSEADHHEPVDAGSLVHLDRKEVVNQGEKYISSQRSQSSTSDKPCIALFHGDINTRPVPCISSLKLHPVVQDSLEKKTVRDMTKCQIFTVPVLTHRRSLALVGPPNSGKSLSYVVPVLSQLLEIGNYSQLRPGNGPRGVFLVSSAQSVRHIARLCSAVSAARLQIITTYGGGLELERKDELTNGCDLIISTPRCLLRLLKHKFVTNLQRLCHLVIDESDILLKIFEPEVREILRLVQRLANKRKELKCSLGVQTVVVGEKWTPVMEDIVMRIIPDPVLCITDPLEGALYARIKPIAYILKPEAKIKKLLELIEENKAMRSVIICNCPEEVIDLRIALADKRNRVLVAHEKMALALLTEAKNSWNDDWEGEAPLMVCSDGSLHDLGVSNATWLLHYSLPNNVYFSDRFSVILDSFKDRISNPKASPPNCKVYIFVDEKNEEQFPELVQFMQRLSTPVPKKVLVAVEKIKKLREMKKNHMPLCQNLVQFGKCWKESKCRDHHQIDFNRDSPKGIPSFGFVKVKILHVHNATHYSARLLAHSETDLNESSWKKLPTKYTLITLKLNTFYSNKDNRRLHGRPKVGDIVGVEMECGTLFYRAKVVELLGRDSKCNPLSVKIFFIDEGMREERSVDELLALPSDLQDLPGEVVDLFLARLLPVDLDNNWSYASTSIIRKSIAKFEESSYFFVGKIALSLGRAIIVDPLQCYEHLELNKCNIVHLSLRHHILKANLAVHNPDHVTHLMSMCKEAGLDVPKTLITDEMSGDDDPSVVEPISWAHLPRDDFVLVNMISAESPSLLFVKRTEFHDRVLQLQKDLDTAMETYKRGLKAFHIRVGQVCVSRSPDGNGWNRTMIKKVVDEQKVEVFFLDHGDSEEVDVSTLYRIPSGYTSRLPFQAIECELVGVNSLDDDWLPEATDAIYDMSVATGTSWKNLFAKVCEVELKGIETGGRHYKIILFDTTGSKDINLNKELMYRGFANWDPATKKYLDTSLVPPRASTTNTAEEDNEEQPEEVVEETAGGELLMDADPHQNPLNQEESDFQSIIASLEEGNFDFEFTEKELEAIIPKTHQFMYKKTLALMDKIRSESSSEMSGDEKKRPLLAITNSAELSCDDSSSGQFPKSSSSDKGKESNSDIESEEESLSDSETEGPRLVPLPGIFTPMAFWHQNDTHVILKISLPSVEKFQLHWTYSYVYFRTMLEDKIYHLRADLFGPIVDKNLQHSVTGLYVIIKMEKVMKGHDWPRLLHDKVKALWLRPDPDYVHKPNEDLSLVESFYAMGVKKADEIKDKEEVSRALEESRASGIPDPCSGEDSDSGSDIVEFNDIPYDPYDPFS